MTATGETYDAYVRRDDGWWIIEVRGVGVAACVERAAIRETAERVIRQTLTLDERPTVHVHWAGDRDD